jgi:hypothetical protein
VCQNQSPSCSGSCRLPPPADLPRPLGPLELATNGAESYIARPHQHKRAAMGWVSKREHDLERFEQGRAALLELSQHPIRPESLWEAIRRAKEDNPRQGSIKPPGGSPQRLEGAENARRYYIWQKGPTPPSGKAMLVRPRIFGRVFAGGSMTKPRTCTPYAT